MLDGSFGNERYLRLDRLLFLVVVEVTGVVANLVHVWRHAGNESVVLLQVNDKVGLRNPAPDLREALDVLRAIHSDAHQPGSRFVEHPYLACRGIEVLGLCSGHGLNDEWRTSTDNHTAYGNGPGICTLHEGNCTNAPANAR